MVHHSIGAGTVLRVTLAYFEWHSHLRHSTGWTYCIWCVKTQEEDRKISSALSANNYDSVAVICLAIAILKPRAGCAHSIYRLACLQSTSTLCFEDLLLFLAVHLPCV